MEMINDTLDDQELEGGNYSVIHIPDGIHELVATEYTETTESVDLINIKPKSSSSAANCSLRPNSKIKIQPSPIWKHAKKVKGQNLLICNYCKREFKDCRNTTNMLKHLETQHPLFFDNKKSLMPKETTDYSNGQKSLKRSVEKTEPTNQEKPPKKQRLTLPGSHGIKEAFKRVNSFKDGGSLADKITNAVLFMICKDLLPISTVENEGFLTLMKVLVPIYKPPSRKTMVNKLESRYDVMKQRFIKELEGTDYYCITCDNWTDCSNQSYMGLTIHYLTKSGEIKTGCLGCIPLHERHTADYLKKSLQEIFEDFNITTERISAIISDGEAAIKKACIELVGKDKHLICAAHVVSHLLPDALNNFQELKRIFDKIKSIVALIRRSIPASDKLKELQLQAGKSEGTVLSLIQDVPTRFTTKVDMVERYIELEQHVYVAMSECENPADMLNREEMKIFKEIFPIMDSVRSVITEISGDTYPTCSVIIPIIRCMERKIDSVIPQTDIGQKFKASIQTAISQRFKNFEHSPLLSVATILDPRFKKVHFKDRLAIYPALNRINIQLKDANQLTLKTCPVAQNELQKSDSIWNFHDLLDENREATSRVDTDLSWNAELEQYLQLKRLPRKDNIFMYWKRVEETFPSLSKVALRQLSVLGTSIPSERLFSKAGLIKHDNRNRLTDSMNQQKNGNLVI